MQISDFIIILLIFSTFLTKLLKMTENYLPSDRTVFICQFIIQVYHAQSYVIIELRVQHELFRFSGALMQM